MQRYEEYFIFPAFLTSFFSCPRSRSESLWQGSAASPFQFAISPEPEPSTMKEL